MIEWTWLVKLIFWRYSHFDFWLYLGYREIVRLLLCLLFVSCFRTMTHGWTPSVVPNPLRKSFDSFVVVPLRTLYTGGLFYEALKNNIAELQLLSLRFTMWFLQFIQDIFVSSVWKNLNILCNKSFVLLKGPQCVNHPRAGVGKLWPL